MPPRFHFDYKTKQTTTATETVQARISADNPLVPTFYKKVDFTEGHIIGAKVTSTPPKVSATVAFTGDSYTITGSAINIGDYEIGVELEYADGEEVELFKQNSPEFTFTRATLRELLQAIGGYIHAEPRLKGDTIVFDRYGGQDLARYYDVNKKEITDLKEYNYSGKTVRYQEVYTYNNDGTLASKAISEAVTQTYTYTYKNNSAQTLDYFSVGTLKVSPKTDCLGRNTGKEIALSGTKVYEEIISYRKVGDHAMQMPSTIRYGDKAGGTYGIRDSLKYAYDEMGNIAKVYENGELSVRYTYDKLSRLIREDNKAIGETCLFDYDNNGNILTKRTLAFTLKGKEEVEELSSTAREYTYEGDRLLSYNGETFTYDGLGNPKTYRGKPLTWSKGRQLTNYNGTTFGYDGQGQRTSKGNIIYTYGSDGKLLKQSDGWEFLYDNGGVMGFIYGNTTDDNRYLYRKDILGNITGILDKNGKIIVKYKYDAWGNHAAVCLNLKDGREEFCDITDETISFTGKYADYKTLAEKNPFRYRSYYYDTETDMYYLKTRYYDPEIGRFITIDGVSYLAPNTINGLNLYAYCNNNPVMRVDPEGNSSISMSTIVDAVAALFEIAIGGAFALVGHIVKTAPRPNNIGIGIFRKNQIANLGKLDTAANILGKISTAVAVISTVISIIDGIKTGIDSGYSAGRIVSNAITDTVIFGGTALLLGAIGGKLGTLLGSALPGLGNVIGAVVGFALGLTLGFFLDLEVGGKSVINHIRDGVYTFWRWLFG